VAETGITDAASDAEIDPSAPSLTLALHLTPPEKSELAKARTDA
jgi:hypothetical protein